MAVYDLAWAQSLVCERQFPAVAWGVKGSGPCSLAHWARHSGKCGGRPLQPGDLAMFRPADLVARPLATRLAGGQGMVVEDELLEPLLEHVRVDLGRRDIGMAQQLLHGAQVRAAVEQVARECMPQDMRRDAPGID